jgi:CheY-like chemotaxis protein
MRGSTFTVRLPRIAAPQTLTEDHGRRYQSIGPCRILLIEDNDDARESLRLLLEVSGHEVYAVGDGLAGVEKALEVKPAVVLIDLGLPGLDGYEVAARIRSAPACRAAVLIALTGYGQSDYRTRGENAGFHAYVVKPVDMAALERVIAASPVPRET